jgi:hypothetical protein
MVSELCLLGLSTSAEPAKLKWAIYALVVCNGVARAFLGPARSALGADLVPRALLPASVSWRTTTFQMAMISGPALGGFLYAWGGVRLAYSVDVALFAVAIALIGMIRYVRTPRRDTGEPLFASLVGGVTFVARQRVLLGAMSLDLFAVLFGGATALLPIFADLLAVGPQGLGIMRSAPAAGSLVISLIMAHRRPFTRAGPTMLWAVAGFGVCMIGFGLSDSFLLSLALLALSGVFDYVSVLVRQTLVQVATPPHLLGRVSAVSSIFVGSSNEIGAFESGVAAKLLGVARSVVFGGAMTLVVVGIIAARIPELRRLGRVRDLEHKSAA